MSIIDLYFLSDAGLKRTNNEDAVGLREPKDAHQLKKSGRLYVVADGLGGHQMGEKASAYALETLLKVYFEAPDISPEKRLRDIIQQVNQNLISFAQKNMPVGEKTATTIVTAVVRNKTLLVANVGDSRAYLIRNGEIRQITHDHSLVGEMLRAGTITEAEARQSKLRNRLTRSVGSDPKLEVELYLPIPLRSGDIILLCTDGLSQYASEKNLLEAASIGTAREIVERLIRFAKERGGSDNITALVIKFGRKSTLPTAKTLKNFAAVISCVLMLTVFSFLGWGWLNSHPVFLKSTSTPTVSSTLTAAQTPTMTPTQTATITPATALTQTTTLTPAMALTQTATLTPTMTLTQTAALTPTMTLTQTATLTPTMTLAQTASLSIASTQTVSPTASDTPIPINPLVNCEYTVQSGDIASQIAEQFQVTLDQIFRQDGGQENMNQIYAGENLIIKNISSEACATGGGIAQSQLPP